jgi:hypothetical protein
MSFLDLVDLAYRSCLRTIDILFPLLIANNFSFVLRSLIKCQQNVPHKIVCDLHRVQQL